jgi:hypothetical protein
LPIEDALAALEALGAERSGDTYVLAPGQDAFCQALCFDAATARGGTLVLVGTRPVGFARDFVTAVHIGLGAFAALVFAHVALTTSGAQFLRLSVAVLLGWAVFMGSFAGARAVLAALGHDATAIQRARSAARRALFARAG